jgi:hypothetical protein
MRANREKDDVRVLLSIEACFQSLIRKSRRFPTRNLSQREKLRSFKLALDFKKAARENRHAQSKARSLADALEALLPFYKRGYGEEGLLRSLSPLAKKQTSIEHLRRLGAHKTADLCEKAKENELRAIAIQRENAAFLKAVRSKLRNSKVTALDLIKKGPRQKRSPSI